MDSDDLNRIGIVLNFLAGFMIAPELIGVERLRRWEANTEARIQRYLDALEKRLRLYPFPGTRLVMGAWMLLFVRTLFGSLFLIFIAAAINIPIRFGANALTLAPIAIGYAYLIFSAAFLKSGEGVISQLRVAAREVREEADYDWEAYERLTDEMVETLEVDLEEFLTIRQLIRKYNILLITWYPLMTLLAMLIRVVQAIVLLPLFLGLLLFMRRVLRTIFTALEGSDRLRARMVSLGIVLFILGSFLQLVATFL